MKKIKQLSNCNRCGVLFVRHTLNLCPKCIRNEEVIRSLVLAFTQKHKNASIEILIKHYDLPYFFTMSVFNKYKMALENKEKELEKNYNTVITDKGVIHDYTLKTPFIKRKVNVSNHGFKNLFDMELRNNTEKKTVVAINNKYIQITNKFKQIDCIA